MSKMKEVKIDEIVREVFINMKSEIVKGEFHISDDSIIRFLEFYTISRYIQENQCNEGVSLRQIHKNKLIAKRNQYTYDKLQDFHSKLNQREIYRIKAEKELLNDMDINDEYKAKSYRIKNTSKIKNYNLFQLDMLFDLHNSTNSVKQTYNRIRRNNLHKIKYKNLKDLVTYLEQRIEKSKLKYKNIELYLIEQTIMKELITTMSYCYNKVKGYESKKDIIKIFLLVAKIPIIDERHKYLETYSEGISYIEKCILEIELYGLHRFIYYCIESIYEKIEYYKKNNIKVKYDKSRFKGIYTDGYKSKYKLKKDFESEDFYEVMNMIKSFNDEFTKMNEKRNIDKFKKEKEMNLEIELMKKESKIDDEIIDF